MAKNELPPRQCWNCRFAVQYAKRNIEDDTYGCITKGAIVQPYDVCDAHLYSRRKYVKPTKNN